MRDDYTLLSEREIAGSGLGTSPSAVAGYLDLQRAVYEDQPQDTAAIEQAAQGAQDTADDALFDANSALALADDAYELAEDAYDLAGTKVSKDVGPVWGAPTATTSRSSFADYTATASATYTQAEVQTLMDRVSLLTKIVAALVVDGRANHTLTP